MTTLAGQFDFDLSLQETRVACTEAIDGLGWRVDSLEPRRLVSYTDESSDHPVKVELELKEAGDRATEVRIVGSDTDVKPVHKEALIAELDRARDAIEASVRRKSIALGGTRQKRGEAGSRSSGDGDSPQTEEQSEPERRAETDPEAGTELVTQRDAGARDEPESGTETGVAAETEARTAVDARRTARAEPEQVPAGWYPDPDDSAALRYWDGKEWTDDRRAAHGDGEAGPMARRDRGGGRDREVRRDRETPREPDLEAEDHREEAPQAERELPRGATKDLIWAISLACGCVAGIAGGFGVPVINYYVPFGFGVAGLVLGVVAAIQPGPTPRWALLALAGSIVGVVAGISGYSDYKDLQDQINAAQQSLQGLGKP